MYAKALTEADANRKTAAEQKVVNEHARKAADALAEDGDADYDPLWEEESLVGKSMLDGGAQFSISGADDAFKKAEVNDNIMEMIEHVKTGNYRDGDKVYLGRVSDKNAEKIKQITGIDVRGFKVAIEARQIQHILKYHGKEGISNRSLGSDELIGKMEYVLRDPEDIRYAGKAQGYSYSKDGHSKTADTVLYEKSVGDKAYYIVQAVPDSKKRTLFIVTAFIGNKGYKTGTPQIVDANRPDATSKNAAAEVPTDSISQTTLAVKRKLSVSAPEETFKKSQTKADSALKRTEGALLSRIGYELKKQKTPRIRSVSDDHRKLNRKRKKKQTQQFLRELHSSSSPRSISIG